MVALFFPNRCLIGSISKAFSHSKFSVTIGKLCAEGRHDSWGELDIDKLQNIPRIIYNFVHELKSIDAVLCNQIQGYKKDLPDHGCTQMASFHFTVFFNPHPFPL